MPGKLAIIDIGSNTIKLLVAKEKPNGGIAEVHTSTLETRIGQGLNGPNPVFSKELVSRASDAVEQLVQEATGFSPDAIRIVATSAVRDSKNPEDLKTEIWRRTNFELEVLSGRREAELVGIAVQGDPRITASNFYLFDLGGGSLEALAFRNRKLHEMNSLQLGCVRLSGLHVAEPKQPFTAEDESKIGEAVADGFSQSDFSFSLPPGAIAVGTGGTLTLSLSILASQAGESLHDSSFYLSRQDLRHLIDLVGSKTFEERLKIQPISAGRADVFPAALTTLLKVTELAGTDGIYHSLFNLRYGVATEMLAALSKRSDLSR